MSLAKDYCKELIRELDQLPVYLPGRNVHVGDVITFRRDGLFARPLGEFQVVTSLQAMDVKIQTRTDENSETYRFSSQRGTSVSFAPNVNAGQVGSGTLKVNFTKAGTLFLAAIDCRREEMINVNTLEQQLTPHRSVVDWNNCYIVTSVTRAARSIVMQSNSTRGQLELTGQTQVLHPSLNLPVEAGVSFSVHSYQDSAFIQDWANQAPIFFSLVRYKRSLFNDWKVGAKAFRPAENGIQASYSIVSVDKAEILADEEVEMA
jgi:hypothetical protein